MLLLNNLPAKGLLRFLLLGTYRHEFDIVGMEIIRITNMAITNAGGVTVLSMRSLPTKKYIDFA